MKLVDLGQLNLRYTSLRSVDYESGGQLYGTMEGRLEGERLTGDVHLTNLAPRRPDNVNMPTLRGILTTADGASIWMELDGIATLREADAARVFLTSCRFRARDPAYSWLNTTFAVVDGILDVVAEGGAARARLYECRSTIAPTDRD